MKKKLTTVIFFLLALSVYGQSRGGVSLDDAIYNSALQIQEGLGNGSKIVVYQFQSQNERISNYVLNELFNLLVNSRKFTVLDRSAQDVVNAELNYQYNTSAGMISDESLADLTRRIGAQAIITGSLDDVGTEYRFRIRVIGTETIAAIISYAVSVNKNDRRITAFSGNPPSIGQNISTGAMNILLGLGSYLEGDIFGGITISAGYAIAAGLIVIEATALDWDSPAVGVPATIGFAVAGVTLVYGFARPFIYNRSSNLAVIMDNTRPEIVPVSDRYTGNGNLGFQLSYTIKF
jgi:hypothetical protein